jgi:Zn-dependent alcohol dehydrogenase
MRGIVYTGGDAMVTDKLEIADPGPKEVKVKIVAAGVCHSDLSVLNGTIPWKEPSVLGHEGPASSKRWVRPSPR